MHQRTSTTAHTTAPFHHQQRNNTIITTTTTTMQSPTSMIRTPLSTHNHRCCLLSHDLIHTLLPIAPQLGKSNHHTNEAGSTAAAAADKPSLFKYHQQPKMADQAREEEHEYGDEPLLLDEASSLLDIYSERSGSEPEEQPSIFRTQSSFVNDGDELNDLWTLKRANPVLLEDDHEDDDDLSEYESPSKRQACAAASSSTALDWDDAIATDAPFRLTVSESGSFLLS